MKKKKTKLIFKNFFTCGLLELSIKVNELLPNQVFLKHV